MKIDAVLARHLKLWRATFIDHEGLSHDATDAILELVLAHVARKATHESPTRKADVLGDQPTATQEDQC